MAWTQFHSTPTENTWLTPVQASIWHPGKLSGHCRRTHGAAVLLTRQQSAPVTNTDGLRVCLLSYCPLAAPHPWGTSHHLPPVTNSADVAAVAQVPIWLWEEMSSMNAVSKKAFWIAPGGRQLLGGDTAGRPDPNWPKDYPILNDIVLSNKSWGGKGGKGW